MKISSGKITSVEMRAFDRWVARLAIKRQLDLLRRQPDCFKHELPVKDAVDDDGRWYAARLRDLAAAMSEFASAGEIGKANLVAMWIGALAREWHVAPALSLSNKIAGGRKRGLRKQQLEAEAQRDRIKRRVAELTAQGVRPVKVAECVASEFCVSRRTVYNAIRRK